ncbi:hypothetical protein BDZ89DRAFT_1157928 [Hymenopellis radicata]|nr:hypothetical protein BDZ89DRAFT_1157928 [Hymenopellis radicata]
MNKARTMRIEAELPPNRWDEFCVTAAYLTARTPTAGIKFKTPSEAWYGRKPDLSHLREIGCRAFVLIPSRNPKIYQRSIECVLHWLLTEGKGVQMLPPGDSQSHRIVPHEVHRVSPENRAIFQTSVGDPEIQPIPEPRTIPPPSLHPTFQTSQRHQLTTIIQYRQYRDADSDI